LIQKGILKHSLVITAVSHVNSWAGKNACDNSG